MGQAAMTQSGPDSERRLPSNYRDVPAFYKHRDNDRRRKSEIFETKFADYKGFTLGTGEETTPFLDSFIRKLEREFGEAQSIKILEGGAGAGEHSIQIARRLQQAHVVAVDTSQTARGILDERIVDEGDLNFKIAARTADVYNVILGLGQDVEGISAFYANAVMHFVHPVERTAMYHALHKVTQPGGLVAVSFKALGDSLQKDATMIRDDEPGGELMMCADGIPRLFVDPDQIDVLKGELRGGGFKVKGKNSVVQWDMKGFNGDPNAPAKFIGIIGKKQNGDKDGVVSHGK